MTLIIRRALVSQHKLLKVEKKVCHSFHCTFLLHTTAASTHSTLVFLYLPRERKSSKKNAHPEMCTQSKKNIWPQSPFDNKPSVSANVHSEITTTKFSPIFQK